MTPRFSTLLSAIILLLLVSVSPVHAQTTGTLKGQVSDPAGAVIPQASVVATSASGAAVSAVSDATGQYSIAVPPGSYTVTASASGFSPFTSPMVSVAAGQTHRMNLALSILVQHQQVQVSAESPALSVNPENNADAVVITGKDLDALSDDPDELQDELNALAGPGAGPNGGQIYIDGFTGGQLPPKSDIRAIVINRNPFSAAYDRPGYGRIEIFTKAGTNALHGEIFVNSNASFFNTSNPFAPAQPPYHTLQYEGNVSGPLSGKASFFFSFQRRNIQDNSIVNAYVPYVPDPANCEPEAGAIAASGANLCALAVPYPQIRMDISPRIDYQLTANQTLTVRYSYNETDRDNDGLGSTPFVLPSQAYTTKEVENRVQIGDSQVYGANTVNNTRFEYIRERDNQTPQINAPAIDVLQNFEGGGSPNGTNIDHQDHYEILDDASMALGKHYLRFGGRLRNTRDANYSNANFQGASTYSNLTAYQANRPSQFSITTGNPSQTASVTDLGLYAEDDWKVEPNFTLSYGLRFESQNHIADKADFGPRIALSYGISRGKTPPKTVLRAGYGIFYHRFTYDLLLNDNRYNLDQTGQVQTIQANPNGTPPGSVGQEPESLPTYYRIQPTLHTPYDIETGLGLERQVNKKITASATYLYSRGLHQLLSRNIDAPLPNGTRPALNLCPTDPIGAPPGTPCNIYEYDSLGIYKEQQLFLNLNARYGQRFTFTSFYVYSRANGDTDGPAYHPSNQYDLMQDYGRQAFDVRNRGFAILNYSAPYGFRISPFVVAFSGSPFNVQLNQDINGDSFFNDRPTFASSSSDPADVDNTKYGSFNISPTPPAGERVIPVNYGNGPVLFSMNLHLSKTFGLGAKVGPGKGVSVGGHHHHGHGGGPGMGLGGSSGNPFGGETQVNRRYSLTFMVSAHNLFNVVNLAPPNGTLGGPPDGTTDAPLFGKSNQLAAGFFSQGSAVRKINLEARFNF